jgi:signal transduction histidine kinase
MFKALINTGVNDTLSANLIKRVRITNILALVVAILVIPYYFLFRHIGANFLSILIPIIVFFQLAIIYMNKLGYINASRFISATHNAIIIFICSTSLGPDTRYYLFYFPQLSAPFIYFETRERTFFLFHFLLAPLLIFLDLFLRLQPFPAVAISYETAVFSSSFLMVFAFLLFGIILFALDKESKNVEETFRKNNQLIAEGESRLREAQYVAHIGSFEGRISNDELWWSDELYRLFELDPKKYSPTMGSFKDLIHPDSGRKFTKELEDIIKTGGILENAYFTKYNNDKKKCFATTANVTRNKDGVISGFSGTVQDVTERRKEEEEKKQLQIRIQEAQKRESLSILAGGVAHDFNNKLTGIIGNIGLMLDDKSIDSKMRYSLLDIEKSAEQSAKLTKKMLAYSGKGHFKVQKFDLSKIVKETIQLSTSTFFENSELNLHLNRNLPSVKGDINQIFQLVTELIINAYESIDKNCGVIDISTKVQFCNEDVFSNSVVTKKPPSGEYVILIIEDSGCGMDRETVSKIFDPFFSTKFTGRGLGLAVIQGIVEGHKGAINVTSEKGVGTKFTVYFPAQDKT